MVRQSDIVGFLLSDILPNGGYLAMLKAYLDRGAKDDGVMSFAVAVFEPFFYELFLHEWQPIVDEWGAPYFHATDFYPGAGDYFWRKRNGTVDVERKARFDKHSRDIPAIIGKYSKQLFVVSFHQNEFERVAPPLWRQQFGGLNAVAAQMAVQSVGFWAKRTNYDGEIAYFYETGDDDEAVIHKLLSQAYFEPDKRAHARMASTPIGVNKGKARGLEVADFLAWHWNKYFADSLAARVSRPLRKDIRALMEFLKIRDESKIDVRLLMGHALEEFLVANGCTRTPKAVSDASAETFPNDLALERLARAGVHQ